MGVFGKLKGAASLAKQIYDEGQSQSAQAQLAGSALQGPAGRHLVGLETAPKTPRIEDPAEWERVMRAELAVRAAAREPYLAPTRSPLRISRFVTRGGTQGQDVAQHLAACGLAARPELVYGVYRVPDRIRPSAGAEKQRVVEWDIVHAATARAPGRRPPRRRRLRRPRDLGRAPDRRAATARRGPRAGLSRAGRPRAGAHPRHRPPRHHRPVPGGHGRAT